MSYTTEDGTIICRICGDMMIWFDGKWYCPNCDKKTLNKKMGKIGGIYP